MQPPAPSPPQHCGAAGEGGALARFVPDAAERGRVLEAVAHECAASAQASPPLAFVLLSIVWPHGVRWEAAVSCMAGGSHGGGGGGGGGGAACPPSTAGVPLGCKMLSAIALMAACAPTPCPSPLLQLEEAVELFMFAGRPRQALRILAQRLSDAVEGAAADASRGAGCTGLALVLCMRQEHGCC